jgi:hypothetical protein
VSAHEQVFRALRAIPEHVYLTVDASIQLELLGGPQPPVSIAYTVDDANVARVVDVGGGGGALIVGRHVGDTRVLLSQVCERARIPRAQHLHAGRGAIHSHCLRPRFADDIHSYPRRHAHIAHWHVHAVVRDWR